MPNSTPSDELFLPDFEENFPKESQDEKTALLKELLISKEDIEQGRTLTQEQVKERVFRYLSKLK